jgi:hypothetical protein
VGRVEKGTFQEDVISCGGKRKGRMENSEGRGLSAVAFGAVLLGGRGDKG